MCQSHEPLTKGSAAREQLQDRGLSGVSYKVIYFVHGSCPGKAHEGESNVITRDRAASPATVLQTQRCSGEMKGKGRECTWMGVGLE